jgi:hypothetical protein
VHAFKRADRPKLVKYISQFKMFLTTAPEEQTTAFERADRPKLVRYISQFKMFLTTAPEELMTAARSS